MTFFPIFFTIGVFGLFCSSPSVADSISDIQKLSLQQAIQIAMERNHDLRLSHHAIDNAMAAGIIAGASPNPSLTLQTTSINPQAGIGAGDLRSKTVDSAIRIDQLIERGGKRKFRQETATRLEEAARADQNDTRRQVRVMVSQSYYDLLASEERLNILSHNAELYDLTVGAAQKRQKAGDLAGADLARLLVDALRSKNDVLQSTADLIKARQTLANLLGTLSSAAQIKLADTWPTTGIHFTEPSKTTIDYRADVIAAQARLDSALSSRKLALASRTRDVSVGIQYEHYPTNQTNTQGSGNSVGLFVQIPLFIRYEYEGEIRAAEVAVDIATETLEKTRDLAKNDVFQNWQDVCNSLALLQRYDNSLLVAAKKSADAAEFAFQHGAISIMDVLDTRRTYRAVQLDALTARVTYAKSLAAWLATQSENIQS